MAQRRQSGASQVPLLLVGTFQSQRNGAGWPHEQRGRRREEQTIAVPPAGNVTVSHAITPSDLSDGGIAGGIEAGHLVAAAALIGVSGSRTLAIGGAHFLGACIRRDA